MQISILSFLSRAAFWASVSLAVAAHAAEPVSGVAANAVSSEAAVAMAQPHPEEQQAALEAMAAKAQEGLAEPAAIFKKVQGQVKVRGPQGERPAQAGMALEAGERVHAGKNSGASVTLSDGSRVVVDERSAFELKAYAYNSTSQEGNLLLNFLGGKLRYLSGLLSKKNPESIKIQAPTAVIGVRGTDVVLEAAHVDQ